MIDREPLISRWRGQSILPTVGEQTPVSWHPAWLARDSGPLAPPLGHSPDVTLLGQNLKGNQ